MNGNDIKIELIPNNYNSKVYDLYEVDNIAVEEIEGNIYCENNYEIKVLNVNKKNSVVLVINDIITKESPNGYFTLSTNELNTFYGNISFTIYINKNVYSSYNTYNNSNYYNNSSNYIKCLKTKKFAACYSKNSPILGSMENMINYISTHNHIIEYDKTVLKQSKTEHDSNSKNNHARDSFEEILAEILEVYNHNYKYFINKAHKIFNQKEELKDFEKLSVINSKTIISIITHPEELIPSAVDTGIVFEDNFYLPKKVKSEISYESLDNFENQAIIGFLLTIINFLNSNCDGISSLQNYENNYSKSYTVDFNVATAANIIKNAQGGFSQSEETMKMFKNQFNNLYKKYVDLFGFKSKALTKIPKRTKVFSNIKHYKEIHSIMLHWFNSPKFSLATERLKVHLTKSNLLYEHYLLLKMINNFIKQGYEFTNKDILSYDVQDAKYVNLIYCNKFEFQKDGITKILYYQPAINEASQNHGIHLYRSVGYSFKGTSDKDGKTSYYTPDYIVKTIDTTEKYTILDAKFSKINNVVSQIPDLVYKYIFSINPTKENVELNGFVAICGKSDRKNDYKENNINVHNMNNSYSKFNDINKNFPIKTIDPLEEFNVNNFDTILNSILLN